MTIPDHVLKRLRDAGHKITPPRQAVLNVLLEHNSHLTSTQILDAVEESYPAISRASVFRTLELLTHLSLIRPIFMETRTPSYVLMSPDGHHSHVLCTSCSRVFEIEDCQVDPLQTEIEARFGVQLSGHLLEFYGLCSNCQTSLVR